MDQLNHWLFIRIIFWQLCFKYRALSGPEHVGLIKKQAFLHAALLLCLTILCQHASSKEVWLTQRCFYFLKHNAQRPPKKWTGIFWYLLKRAIYIYMCMMDLCIYWTRKDVLLLERYKSITLLLERHSWQTTYKFTSDSKGGGKKTLYWLASGVSALLLIMKSFSLLDAVWTALRHSATALCSNSQYWSQC